MNHLVMYETGSSVDTVIIDGELSFVTVNVPASTKVTCCRRRMKPLRKFTLPMHLCSNRDAPSAHSLSPPFERRSSATRQLIASPPRIARVESSPKGKGAVRLVTNILQEPFGR